MSLNTLRNLHFQHNKPPERMLDTIHQEVLIAASPEQVLEVLTNSAEFRSATGGAPAEIDPTEGGSFSCFGGMIVGRNIEIVPGQRIVQAWRVKTWEPGIYSIVRFQFLPDRAGTRIMFDHFGFPAAERDHLETGWHDNYWIPLANYFAQHP